MVYREWPYRLNEVNLTKITVKELKEVLNNFPDDIEVIIDSTKNALGTFSVNSINKCSAKYLESNWREIQDDVCLIRFR